DLEGGYFPAGTITFTLVYNSNVVDTETVTVHQGNGWCNTLTGYTLPTSVAVNGTYQWNATYTSDTTNNNNASYIGAANERVYATPASQPINTSTAVTGVTLRPCSVRLNDTADLEGGYFPAGTITFTLVYNIATVDTETV